MARHQQEKSSRFSVLFDEYPDLYDTATIFPLFFCKNTFLSNVKIYTAEEELVLSKKVKKYLFKQLKIYYTNI